MNKLFLLFGVGVGGNYGCEAIVRGTEVILRHRFPASDIVLPSQSLRRRDRQILKKGSSIRVVDVASKWDPLCVMSHLVGNLGFDVRHTMQVPSKLVRKSTCILSIGGDLYTFAEKEKNWPFPYRIVQAGNEMIKSGTPYVIWCASVGPFEKAGKRLPEITEHLKRSRAIIVRESDSYQYLRDELRLRDNVYLAADPAFLMEPETFDALFLTKRDLPIVAVNFSQSPIEHVHGHKRIEETRASLAENLEALISLLDVRILLVPHVFQDHAFVRPIYEKVRKHAEDRSWVLPQGLGSPRTKWAVSQCNALVTMRFHCALAGMGTRTPTLVLVSTKKGSKICKDIYGNLDWALNIQDLTKETLVRKVRDLLDNEENLRQHLTQSIGMMKDRALSAADVLDDILANDHSK